MLPYCLSLIGVVLFPLVGLANAPEGNAVSHRVIGADKGHVAIVNARGEVEWEYPCKGTPHDLHQLASGNLLWIEADTSVVEVNRAKEVVWKYTPQPKQGYTGRVEIHAVQRLDDGKTMIAESGNQRIVEVDREGKITAEVPLTVEHPHPHRDTRLARKLASGNYLVCQEGDGAVREYDPKGKVVWTYKLDLAGRPRSGGHGPEGHGTEVYGAIRLANGNTLIGCGNGNRVIEVDRDGKTVWSLEQKELPGITLAWVTTVQQLPNGNIVVGNCHAGPENPQLIEVTREKQVVWQFRDFKVFGNSLATALLADEPKAIR